MAVWRAWSSVVTAGESPPWTQNIWLSMHAAKLQPAQGTRQGNPIMTILASQAVWQAKCLFARVHSIQDRLIVCHLLLSASICTHLA